MKRSLLRFALAAILPLAIAASAFPEAGNCTQKDASTRPDCPQAIAFFHRMQTELRNGNRQALAQLVHYPLRTAIGKKRASIGSPKQLLAHFNEIFDEGVRCEVLDATDQDVWGNWQGFTVGDGAIWFDGIIPKGTVPDTTAPDYRTKYPFRIIAVNNDSYYPCARR